MDNAIYPLQLPAPLSHPRLDEFCATLRCAGDPFLVPLADRLLPIENCYWNVLALIEQHGGEIVFGWMIRHWPGLYLAAEHHAVWKRPDGILLDVTERRPEFAAPTTFAFDTFQDIDVSSSPNICIEYLPLTLDDRVVELIDLSAKLDTVAQSVNSFLANELGQSHKAQMAVARGEAPDRVQVNDVQHKNYEVLLKRGRQLRQEIGKLIHSLVSRPPNLTARAATDAFFGRHPQHA